MHLISKRFEAINSILMEDKHPCWTFNWTLSNEFDVASLVSIIEDTRDGKPSSRSADVSRTTHASYYIAAHNENTIRVDVSADVSADATQQI
jgi:hypothetical protein